MSPRAVHLVVFDGFADWEAAYALAELRRAGGHEVRTVGFGPGTVRSMGGVAVRPDLELAELRPADTRLLILPGGDMWEDATAYPASELSRRMGELAGLGTPVAAICAGTLAVARAGLLDDRRHTSNARDYHWQAHRLRCRFERKWQPAHITTPLEARVRRFRASAPPACPSCPSRSHDIPLDTRFSRQPLKKLHAATLLGLDDVGRAPPCSRTARRADDRAEAADIWAFVAQHTGMKPEPATP